MSPKGTHPLKVAGSQLALKPGIEATMAAACPIQAGSANAYAPMMEGFNPPGRKKFIREASTKGVPLGETPHPLTVKGLDALSPDASAALKFLIIRSPRMVLALMGRFRWRPPLKL